MARLIDTMEGSGTVRSSSGDHADVHYVLQVYQDQISVANMQNPHAMMPGFKSIEGRISPVCFSGDPELTLELQDGHKLKFFLRIRAAPSLTVDAAFDRILTTANKDRATQYDIA